MTPRAALCARQEHIEQCRRRALACLEAGDASGAVLLLLAELPAHPETREDLTITLVSLLSLEGRLTSVEEVRAFVLGIH